MIRGYSITQQLHFLETECEPALLKRVLETVPSDIRTAFGELKAAEWYPREYSASLLRAVAWQHRDDERATHDALVRCGSFIAAEATNTFLRLLMKVLTPTLFAKKLPEFWRRDHTAGHFEVDTSEAKNGSLRLALCDVEGFDHIGVVGIGWMTYGFAAMGKSDVVVTQTGWKLEHPAPNKIQYHLRWS